MFTPDEMKQIPTNQFIFYQIDEEPTITNIYFFNNKFEMELINFQIHFALTGENKKITISFPKELISTEEERIEASRVIGHLIHEMKTTKSIRLPITVNQIDISVKEPYLFIEDFERYQNLIDPYYVRKFENKFRSIYELFFETHKQEESVTSYLILHGEEGEVLKDVFLDFGYEEEYTLDKPFEHYLFLRTSQDETETVASLLSDFGYKIKIGAL